MSISVSISEQMDNITTTIFQNTADQMFTGVIGLTALNYKNNVGHLMLALLSALGFVCSDDGKTLSHSSNPTACYIIPLPPPPSNTWNISQNVNDTPLFFSAGIVT